MKFFPEKICIFSCRMLYYVRTKCKEHKHGRRRTAYNFERGNTKICLISMFTCLLKAMAPCVSCLAVRVQTWQK